MTGLEDRVAALERRFAELEVVRAAPGGDFWALEALRERSEGAGAVLIAGTVTLPDERRAEWQEAATTASLLADDWADHADTLAAVGHPVRLRLLQRVLSGVDTVSALVETDGVGTSGQVYHHLRALIAAGWLHGAGHGRYEVPAARVVPLLGCVLGVRR